MKKTRIWLYCRKVWHWLKNIYEKRVLYFIQSNCCGVNKSNIVTPSSILKCQSPNYLELGKAKSLQRGAFSVCAWTGRGVWSCHSQLARRVHWQWMCFLVLTYFSAFWSLSESTLLFAVSLYCFINRQLTPSYPAPLSIQAPRNGHRLRRLAWLYEAWYST